MEHNDFHSGLEFFTATGRWRCTDVGRRVVVAISLEPHTVVSHSQNASGMPVSKTALTDDQSWFNGPPYAVVEKVFDECDLEGCFLEQLPMVSKLRRSP